MVQITFAQFLPELNAGELRVLLEVHVGVILVVVVVEVTRIAGRRAGFLPFAQKIACLVFSGGDKGFVCGFRFLNNSKKHLGASIVTKVVLGNKDLSFGRFSWHGIGDLDDWFWFEGFTGNVEDLLEAGIFAETGKVIVLFDVLRIAESLLN